MGSGIQEVAYEGCRNCIAVSVSMYVHVCVCVFVHINRNSPPIFKGKKKTTHMHWAVRGQVKFQRRSPKKIFGTISLGSILRLPQQGPEHPSCTQVDGAVLGMVWARRLPATVVL